MLDELKVCLESVQPGSRAIYTCKEPKSSEWMLDFVLWQEGYGSILGLESELSDSSPERIVRDFRKLMSFKAPLKVYIFQQRQTTGPVIELITAELTKFQQHFSSELYIIVEAGDKPKGGYRLYGFQPSINGGADTSELQDLGFVTQMSKGIADKAKVVAELRKMLSVFRPPQLQLA